MGLVYWARENSSAVLREILRSTFNGVPDKQHGEITGELSSPGFLGQLKKHFVLGKLSIWDEVIDPRQVYIECSDAPLLPKGLVLTCYDGISTRVDRGKLLITQKRNIERAEMHPFNYEGNMIKAAFESFDMVHTQRWKTGYNPRLFLYDFNGHLSRWESIMLNRFRE